MLKSGYVPKASLNSKGTGYLSPLPRDKHEYFFPKITRSIPGLPEHSAPGVFSIPRTRCRPTHKLSISRVRRDVAVERTEYRRISQAHASQNIECFTRSTDNMCRVRSTSGTQSTKYPSVPQVTAHVLRRVRLYPSIDNMYSVLGQNTWYFKNPRKQLSEKVGTSGRPGNRVPKTPTTPQKYSALR